MPWKTVLLTCALACLHLLTMPAARAAPLGQWDFNEDQGTTLNHTVNTGTVAGTWDTAIGGSATTGTGDFRVSRPGGSDSLSIFELAAGNEAISDGSAYIHVNVSGFNYGGGAAGEVLRFEFVSSGRTTITAGMALRRTTSGGDVVVQLEGRALGSGTSIDAVTLVTGSSSDASLDLVLELDKDTNTYGIWYRFNGGDYQLAGTGTVDPNRVGNRISFEAMNDFSFSGEFVDIDRITVTRDNPIPEPAGSALLGLTGLLIMSRQPARK